MKGKIVLLPFPFTDLKTTKRRPALVILERPNDVVVAFISSTIPKQKEQFQIIINKEDKDFFLTGLKVSSAIYLDKIATISKNLIIGELGQIGKVLKHKINKKMKIIYHLT
jgi:mRNA interferase MazF